MASGFFFLAARPKLDHGQFSHLFLPQKDPSSVYACNRMEFPEVEFTSGPINLARRMTAAIAHFLEKTDFFFVLAGFRGLKNNRWE
jgi:hypothetical protein